jgi:trehalose-6-phosphate synthase
VPSPRIKTNIQQERLKSMKTITTVLFLVAAATALGQTTQPPVNVQISTEVEELARGYATAFSGMTHTPIYLIHSRDDTTTVLVSLRSVKAVAGVLIVQDEKGLTYVLNPRDVVMITDAPPKKDR